jgi:hypothetical protein
MLLNSLVENSKPNGKPNKASLFEALVIRTFVDRYTGRGYNPGARFESNSASRIKELQDKGYLAKPDIPEIPAAENKLPEKAIPPKAQNTAVPKKPKSTRKRVTANDSHSS